MQSGKVQSFPCLFMPVPLPRTLSLPVLTIPCLKLLSILQMKKLQRCSFRLLMLLLTPHLKKAQRRLLNCFSHRITSGQFSGRKLTSLSRLCSTGFPKILTQRILLPSKKCSMPTFRICLYPASSLIPQWILEIHPHLTFLCLKSSWQVI